jgi:soluble lytic murein transglycosylase-like protein
MEKRPKKTPDRTLKCAVLCTKFVLISALFLPTILAFEQFSEQTKKPVAPAVAKVAETIERPRPKELVKVYSIVKSHRPDISDSEAWSVSEAILGESSKRNLDPLLVLALIRVESDFQYTVVSPSGARGLMQIMPETGKFLAQEIGRESNLRAAAFKPESLDDPHFNIRLGTYYLHDLKKQFRDLTVTLTAYNFGPIEIQNRLDNNLEFPSDFAALVLDAYERYKKAKHPTF